MKIVITGHAEGIGKEISDLLSSKGHTIIGLDLQNGHDINRTSDIVNAAEDADVFINNAYSFVNSSAQLKVFKKIYFKWKKEQKHIINMNSFAKYFDPEVFPNLSHYTRAKQRLHAAHVAAVTDKDRKVVLSQINPSFTPTTMTRGMKANMLDISTIALAVEQCINSAVAGVEISDMTIKLIGINY